MNDLIEIVKIGGPATAMAVIFIWYIDRSDKRHKNTIDNHMEHNTDAMLQNARALEKVSKSIDILGKTLRGKVVK